MNNYIVLDGKRYYVLHEGYSRKLQPPKTVERSVTGVTLVSTGPGQSDMVTNMALLVPLAPSGQDGGLSDLDAAITKSQVSYSDHRSSGWGGGTFNVTITALEVLQLSPMPDPGYIVAISWQKVLS